MLKFLVIIVFVAKVTSISSDDLEKLKIVDEEINKLVTVHKSKTVQLDVFYHNNINNFTDKFIETTFISENIVKYLSVGIPGSCHLIAEQEDENELEFEEILEICYSIEGSMHDNLRMLRNLPSATQWATIECNNFDEEEFSTCVDYAIFSLKQRSKRAETNFLNDRDAFYELECMENMYNYESRRIFLSFLSNHFKCDTL